NGGIRVFSDTEIDTLKVIECLKSSGMPIKSIKEFLGWCQEGDITLEKRRKMFHIRLDEVEKQIEALQETKNMLKFKCWYYDTAVATGSEETVKNIPADEIPEDIRSYKI
ncbi:MAG: MerR family DNA-binding protein, partial [Lachnospiraceae bacterium]|nr:MerR family DNA-binding protein [Lachnospiraceae bacterium]